MNSGLSAATWTVCGFLLSWMVPASAAREWIAVALVVAAAIALAVYLWRD